MLHDPRVPRPGIAPDRFAEAVGNQRPVADGWTMLSRRLPGGTLLSPLVTRRQRPARETAYPFYARAAVAADPENPPADLALRLTVGTGLVRGRTEYVGPSNAGAEFLLGASGTYAGWLEATISTAMEITALEIVVDELSELPASPAGNEATGAPPTASYHPFFTVETTADRIDWTTLTHTQSNFTLAVVPSVVDCETQTLLSLWLTS